MVKIDVRTPLIVILVILVIWLAFFWKGGGDDTWKELVKKRENENAVLQEAIESRNDTIKMYKDSAAFHMRKDSANVAEIEKLRAIREKQELDINFLKSKLEKVPEVINDATDPRRIELWKDYFRKKGIKT